MVSYNDSISTPPSPFMVLLYDHDSTHLQSIEDTLLKFGYKVTKFLSPDAALLALQTDKYTFDIVVCVIHMSDVHGLRLVRIAGLEFDLPVVLITSDSSEEMAFKGILNGACKCLAKPVQPETLKHIWQYVLCKRIRSDFSSLESAHIQDSVGMSSSADASAPSAACGRETNSSNPKASKKRIKEKVEEEECAKKARFIWTKEPHQIFIDAVKSLTLEKAVPKKILEYMKNHGVRNITRAIVASHLQKYRLNFRKYHRKLENNEVDDNSSKLFSQSKSTLNVTKEMPLEVFKSEEKVICAMKHLGKPQFDPLEQTTLDEDNMWLFSDFSHMNLNEHIPPPPNVSNQFSNNVIVDASNNVAQSSDLSRHDALNDCLYFKILKDYEETHKSQNLENIQDFFQHIMHASNNRNSSHSIGLGKDHFVNVVDVNTRPITQDQLKQDVAAEEFGQPPHLH